MTASNTQSQKVQWIEISPAQAGQRVDNFLIALEKGVPKSRIYRALRKGEVRVNKGRIKQTYKLQAGDVLRVPPLRTDVSSAPTRISDGLAQLLNDSILYEDEALLVLNKPAGIAVHAGSGIRQGIIEALRVLRADLPFLELVHRLDRDTSGCLLLAKSRAALLSLQAQMQSDGIDKRYLALTKGRWPQQDNDITATLRKNTLSSGERMVIVTADGKHARTVFSVRAEYGFCQLVAARLYTGRTHQIRVHAADSGHPLAGDDKYGDREFNKKMKEYGLGRLFLHAWRLGIAHPLSGTPLLLEAPLAGQLAEVITKLEQTA